jgi:hypothetical protein
MRGGAAGLIVAIDACRNGLLVGKLFRVGVDVAGLLVALEGSLRLQPL